ncbi:MAG TPA: hypothetical protein VFJ94_05365 [Intrasporangium sp.]|uniref:hypothetical protein n=1 Tax=Intrasporangium sp. TaxID=1925024 RepID=UPI002D79E719|nr:hypothetical protein [Intrasporangium sp.]HET7397933.1 hypothetical protein [Intrasporangium sp.]
MSEPLPERDPKAEFASHYHHDAAPGDGGFSRVTGAPAYGTGIVYLHQERDGWAGEWTDEEGHIIESPQPVTFPVLLEWARAKPAPEIRIRTGISPPP